MKKIAAILLILTYSMSSFGIGLREFYCCGKLKSVSILIINVEKEKCNKAANQEGCCKTKYQHFKVKDNHIAIAGFTVPVKFYSDSYSFTVVAQSISAITQLTEVNALPVHAPPLHQAVPVYIANCVFRI
jgi:hypothetical protein